MQQHHDGQFSGLVRRYQIWCASTTGGSNLTVRDTKSSKTTTIAHCSPVTQTVQWNKSTPLYKKIKRRVLFEVMTALSLHLCKMS